MTEPFEIQLRHAIPHGVLVGVSLPGTPDPVPEPVLDQLLPAEREHALTLRKYRQVEWVGGRLAARAAFRILGRRTGPVLTDSFGAPVAKGPLAVSITHKRHVAIALAARAETGVVGVDLEDYGPPRPQIAERVLTAAELEAVNALPEDRRWTSILVRFSVKEALYKALAPRLRRYVDFKEVEVTPHTDNTATVALALENGPEPAHIDARFAWLDLGLLSSVRLSWGDESP